MPAAGLLAWVPTSGPVGVRSIVSYDGGGTLGVVVDAGIVPDLACLRQALHEELEAFRTVRA